MGLGPGIPGPACLDPNQPITTLKGHRGEGFLGPSRGKQIRENTEIRPPCLQGEGCVRLRSDVCFLVCVVSHFLILVFCLMFLFCLLVFFLRALSSVSSHLLVFFGWNLGALILLITCISIFNIVIQSLVRQNKWLPIISQNKHFRVFGCI